MHQLRHRKLVQILAVCSSAEPIWIVTELMINGALLDYLRKDEGRVVKFPIVIDMAAQVREMWRNSGREWVGGEGVGGVEEKERQRGAE